MANLLKNSFVGGIIDAALSARVDLPKYNQSCKELKNFILQPQGGVYRRPALKFVSEPALAGTTTSTSVQPTLVPLVYNIEDSYIIALLNLNFKVYRNDAYLAENGSYFTEAQNKIADYAQSADTLYLANKGATPFKIIRTSSANFQELLLTFASNYPSPTGFTGSFLGGAATTPIKYAITAVTDDGQESLPAFYTIPNGRAPGEWAAKNWVDLSWTDPSPSYPPINMRALVIYETIPRLVVVGDNQYGYYSANGTSWTITNTLNIPSNQVYAIAVNSSGLFVIGGVSAQGATSVNGITWLPFTFPFGTAPCQDIAYSVTSGWWVAVSQNASSSQRLCRSNNPVTGWTSITPNNAYGIGAVAVNETGPRFVVIGQINSSAYSDDSGATWTPGGSTGFSGQGGASLIYSSSLSMWIGGSSGGLTNYSTDNGATWTARWEVAVWGSSAINDFAVNEAVGRVVGVADGGKIGFTDDGINWERVDNTTFGSSHIKSVVYSTSLSKFVAAGFDGKVAMSSDGVIWETSEFPDSYNIYKVKQGIYGYIGNARGVYTFRDDNYDPVITDSIPEAYNPFAVDNPGVVALFQQRLWFANTLSKSQTVFASRVADFENLNYSPFIRPDDSIENTIFSSRPDGIQWMVPFNQTLKVGTIERVWDLTSASGGAITPTDINIRPVLDWGASKVKPVLAGNSLVYVENKGSKLFDLFERQEYLGLTGNNLSVNTPALFEGFDIVSMAFQRTPDPIIWCVRDDGKVIALSYLKNEDLWGWHIHETDGLFKNVAVIPGSVYDEVYFTVYRNSKYLLEKIDAKWSGDIEDSRFLDSFVYKENATPFTVVAGLSHLEGKTVKAVSDGVPITGTFVVSSGQITLSSPVTNVYVGLPYTSVLAPLSSEFATQNQGASMGKTKTIGQLVFRFKESLGGKAGPRLNYLDTISSYAYDNVASGETFNGDVKIPFPDKFDSDSSFYIVQDEALPMTISALFIELTMGKR